MINERLRIYNGHTYKRRVKPGERIRVGKRGYSREEALAQAKRHKKQPYFCQVCCMWHIGRPKRHTHDKFDLDSMELSHRVARHLWTENKAGLSDEIRCRVIMKLASRSG